MMQGKSEKIKAIIGLGNPGARFQGTRHNIGFAIVDALAACYQGSWHEKDDSEVASISIDDHPILLIKPQMFMNFSGRVIPFLHKKGINAEHILVVHDELEKSFGVLSLKQGGSARGHNGIRSIIEAAGPDFLRLRFGIGRPEQRERVGDYVIEPFSESAKEIDARIQEAIKMIKEYVAGKKE